MRVFAIAFLSPQKNPLLPKTREINDSQFNQNQPTATGVLLSLKNASKT